MNQIAAGHPQVCAMWVAHMYAPATTSDHFAPRYVQRRGAGHRREAASIFSIMKAGYY